MKRAIQIRFTTCACATLLLALVQPTLGHAAQKFTLETAQAAGTKGNPKALYFLARCYAKGDGVPQDNAKAAEYMRRSAEKGYAFAQNDLGAYYARGFGVNQDYEEAARWYRKAADQGDSLAQFSLGRAYSLGRGLPKDTKESLSWYEKAAKQHQPDALMALGDIYLNGSEGVPIDCKEARRWFEKALKQGRVDALNSLGFIYEHGSPPGIVQDLKQAVKCYGDAAEQGDAKGQMNLGRMYLGGLGVERDPVEAYKWFYLARRKGEGASSHYLSQLNGQNPLTERLLTADQITEAVRRADEWQQSADNKKLVDASKK